MCRARVRTVVAAAFAGVFPLAVQAADPPPDVTVPFEMHEDPNDSESDVVFIVTFDLEGEDWVGDSVGWRLANVEFREIGTGAPDTVWNEDSAYALGIDGLWWVDHADRYDPLPSEFVLAPIIAGLATAQDPADDDLDYFLGGVAYDPPPGGPPYPTTAALDYEFTTGDDPVVVVKVSDPNPDPDVEPETVKIKDVIKDAN